MTQTSYPSSRDFRFSITFKILERFNVQEVNVSDALKVSTTFDVLDKFNVRNIIKTSKGLNLPDKSKADRLNILHDLTFNIFSKVIYDEPIILLYVAKQSNGGKTRTIG